MTTTINPEPTAVSVKTGVTTPKKVAEALSGALADTFSQLIKTHAVHWNVEGPLFFAVHNLTEAHYNELLASSLLIAAAGAYWAAGIGGLHRDEGRAADRFGRWT